MPCKTHCNFCRELCRNGWTNGCAVWVVDSGRPKEAQVQSYSIRQVAPMCPHGRAHWRRLANMIEPSICGSDAVWCQINLTTCFEKLPLTGKFAKFCSERIHRDTDRRVVFKFHEIWWSGNPWSRALLSWQKIFAWLSRSRYCADHAQSPRASPRQCTQSAPDFIQIGSLLAEFYANMWTPWKQAVKSFQYSAEA